MRGEQKGSHSCGWEVCRGLAVKPKQKALCSAGNGNKLQQKPLTAQHKNNKTIAAIIQVAHIPVLETRHSCLKCPIRVAEV